ncbi:hypothetical protein [uncultured Clostridium sp.]|uniref:hypothetical protein n=1 Tax=uncultured Clostridium sp. TaxID=59620 RepID=UPI00261CA99B|nr:hypothetical protein [uncultured Clostridium sp.]
MAKFCSKECKEAGAICDLCVHYEDDYPDGNAGIGICLVTKEKVLGCDGYGCDNFECFRLRGVVYEK